MKKQLFGKLRRALRYLAVAYAAYCGLVFCIGTSIYFLSSQITSSSQEVTGDNHETIELKRNYFGSFELGSFALTGPGWQVKLRGLKLFLDWPKLLLFQASIPLVHVQKAQIILSQDKDARPPEQPSKVNDAPPLNPSEIIPIPFDWIIMPFSINLEHMEVSDISLTILDAQRKPTLSIEGLRLFLRARAVGTKFQLVQSLSSSHLDGTRLRYEDSSLIMHIAQFASIPDYRTLRVHVLTDLNATFNDNRVRNLDVNMQLATNILNQNHIEISRANIQVGDLLDLKQSININLDQQKLWTISHLFELRGAISTPLPWWEGAALPSLDANLQTTMQSSCHFLIGNFPEDCINSLDLNHQTLVRIPNALLDDFGLQLQGFSFNLNQRAQDQRLEISTDMATEKVKLALGKADLTLRGLKQHFAASTKANMNTRRVDQLSLELKVAELSLAMMQQTLHLPDLGYTVTAQDLSLGSESQIKTNGYIDDLIRLENHINLNPSKDTVEISNMIALDHLDRAIQPAKALIDVGLASTKLPNIKSGNLQLHQNIKAYIPGWSRLQPNFTNFDVTLTDKSSLTNFKASHTGIDIVSGNFETKSQIQLGSSEQALSTEIKLEHLSLSASELGHLEIKQNRINIDASTKSSIADFSLWSLLADIKVNQSLRGLKHTLNHTTMIDSQNLKSLLVIRPGGVIRLKTLQIDIPDLGLESHILASCKIEDDATISFSDLKFEASMQADKGFLENQSQSTIHSSGSLKLSAQITTIKDTISILSKAIFNQFHLKIMDTFAIENAEGELPFQMTSSLSKLQELSTNPDKLKEGLVSSSERDLPHSQFISEKPVSWDRPFRKGRASFQVDAIRLAAFDIENLYTEIDLSSDMLDVSHFMAETLNGSIQAQLQIQMNTFVPQQINTRWHINNLDTSKLLPYIQRYQPKLVRSEFGRKPYISSAGQLYINVVENDINGNIGISEIGRDQFLILLYYLDPNNTNPSLKPLKKALDYADVSRVMIPIRNATLGLDVDFSLVALPIPVPTINGIVLSQVFSNVKSSLLSSQDVTP